MYELHYTVKAYFLDKPIGLAEVFETDNFEAMKTVARAFAEQGYALSIFNNEIGTVIEVTAEQYFMVFEGDSPITEF